MMWSLLLLVHIYKIPHAISILEKDDRNNKGNKG